MANIPEISLKTQQFNPIGFTPIGYSVQTPDLSILERSLAQREARKEKAAQQRTALDVALGDIESKLNPAEAKWFTNYKNNISQQIQNSVDIGDFGNAIRTATTLAGETAKDSAILSRISANEKYQSWLDKIQQRVDKGEISQDAAKWAIATNPYQFNETKDIFGNVIGGKLQDQRQIYNTINWGDVAAKAAAFNRPDIIQRDRRGGNTNPALYSSEEAKLAELSGTLGSSSNSWVRDSKKEEVTAEELLDTIGNMLNMPDLKNQAIQDYDVSIWNYQQQSHDGTLSNVDRRNLIEQGLFENGSPISLAKYLENKSKLFVNALAYRKESTTRMNENSFSFAGGNVSSSSGNEGEEGGNNVSEGDSNGYGPIVEKTVKDSTKGANNAASRVNNRFK